jgi:hypothetical protein
LFIVQPFQKDSDIRSALGFMSLASRWGDYLFPGITVLTRDLYAVQAMHQVAVGIGACNPERRPALRRRTTDLKIARKLRENLARVGDRRPLEDLLQTMTYWQRYGSLFTHFALLDDRRAHSAEWYRRLIFSASPGKAGQDDAELRGRRLAHFKWYRRNRVRLVAVEEDGARGLFRGADGAWRRWWLTGRRPPPDVPEPIRLVRELEFFFVVWQTLFEAAVRTIWFSGRLSLTPLRTGDPITAFAALVSEAKESRQPTPNAKLVRTCMRLHETIVAPHAVPWQRAVTRRLGAAADRFIRLHNGETIADFAKREGARLLDGLAGLHNEYCVLQGKPYVASVRRFRPTPLVSRPADISMDLSSWRWGLFGYRFTAAVGLFDSADRQSQ